VLSAPIGGYRLLAKIDAIFWSETGFQQKALIVDWKTSRQRPRRQWLAERLQTRIYPYVLTQTGAQGIMLEPEDITMVYWFPLWPEQPERFAYSRQQFDQDKVYLERLIKEIASLDESAFHLTPNEERCNFCTYRSLCERGIKAGSLELDFEDQQEDRDFFFDIDQIAEVGF
jgi:CRISPR/Cas system-associated exonuclease Cas4 (RecB family)